MSFMHASARAPWTDAALRALAFAGAYVFAAYLGHALSFGPGGFATFWPPSGLFLAVLLMSSPRRWPLYVLAAVVGNLFFDVIVNHRAVAVSVSYTSGNALEAVIGASVLRHFLGREARLERVWQVVVFALAGAGGATLASAAIGAHAAQLAYGGDYWTAFRLWWIGDVLGVLTFAPLLLLLGETSATPARPKIDALRTVEGGAMLVSVAIASHVAIAFDHGLLGTKYVLFPALLWGALRFGIAGAAPASAIASVVAVLTATSRAGWNEPLLVTPDVQVLVVQSFLAVAIVATLVIGALTDERRAVATELARQASLMQAVFDQIADPIMVKDRSGRAIASNRAAARLHGNGGDPPAGGTARPALDEKDAIVLATQCPVAGDEAQVVDGKHRTLATVRAPLLDPRSNEVAGVIVTSRDVTEDRGAADERARAEQRFRDLARASGDWFWESDAEHRFTWLSDDVEKILGVPAAWHYGKTRQELAGDQVDFSLEPWKSHLEALARHEPIRNFVYKRVGPDGERWMCVNAIPVFDDRGTFVGYRGAGSDVTARVVAEERGALAEDMRRAKELAERANHAKTEFLSRISHELRTPLNAILGFAQTMALEDAALDDKQRQSLQHIQQAGAHLLVLINEVLALSNIEAGRVELSITDVGIAGLVADCVAMVEPLATQSRVRIDVNGLAGESCIVRADPMRLKQVLLNLVSNAVKFSHAGGTVRLQARPATATGFTDILVQDDGVGFTEAQLARLMLALHDPDRPLARHEGTGIGLTITKRFVDMMGGVLLFSSQAGAGTTVTLRLPSARVAIAEPVARPRSLDDIPRAHYGPRRVLYIEDNPINARVVARMLQSRPQVEVSVAVDGESGLRSARELRPHLLLVDLDLPDITGFEVLQRVRADPILSGTPCVAVTASVMPETVARGRALGFVDFIGKPVEMRDFIARIDVLLEAETLSI